MHIYTFITHARKKKLIKVLNIKGYILCLKIISLYLLSIIIINNLICIYKLFVIQKKLINL